MAYRFKMHNKLKLDYDTSSSNNSANTKYVIEDQELEDLIKAFKAVSLNSCQSFSGVFY